NPRFTTSEEDLVKASKIMDKAITGETFRRMSPKEDPFKIEELCQSIRENGWQPVDAMFVQRIEGSDGRYVVLEGNRRLTAIIRLLEDKTLKPELRASISTIHVLEILADGQDEATLRKQI